MNIQAPAGTRTRWPKAALLIAVAACACLTACVAKTAARDRLPWSDARQLILVVAPDWNTSHATLRTYTRDADAWQPVSAAIPVVIGRAGAAWGIGLHPAQRGLQKKEGDGRSPAGVFALGHAFGYAPTASTALPYDAMDADDWCIDVDGSPLYNRIVNARTVGADAVAGSSEPMRLDLHADGDARYRLGFVIEHNPRGHAGAGSCIFAHLWRSADSTTAGCTAMTEPAMRDLLAWLRADRHPVFVLLPESEYIRLRAAWALPANLP